MRGAIDLPDPRPIEEELVSHPHVGDVLDKNSPEPPDGTFLLDRKGFVEKYVSADIGGNWRTYVERMGPFVVAPDYDFLVYGRTAQPGTSKPDLAQAGSADVGPRPTGGEVSSRLTTSQENALVAAVNFPADSPAFGVIRRGNRRSGTVRALTEVSLMKLRRLGLVAEWRTREKVNGSPVTSVKLNEQGIALGMEIARQRDPAWEPEGPRY